MSDCSTLVAQKGHATRTLVPDDDTRRRFDTPCFNQQSIQSRAIS
jgi:hypothetical protein